MTPGTILFDPNFQFEDGETGRKLFVVLNNGKNGQYLVAKTTSKPSRFTKEFGCNSKHRFPNFYLPNAAAAFKTDTWIQLDYYYPLESGRLIENVMNGLINQIFVLERSLALLLVECVAESDDLSGEWVTPLEEAAESIRADIAGNR